jgi:hypothetical protein
MTNNSNAGCAERPDRGGWSDPGRRVVFPEPPKSKPNVKAPPPPPTPKGR